MRKLVLAAALATSVLATPALARDGSIYAGVEAGVVQPSMLNLKFENINVSTDNALRIKHKRGYTVDGIVGYDFGMFRVEGEAGYQRAKLNHVEIDSVTLRQVGNFTSSNQFTTDGHGSVWSGMINGILDLGSQELAEWLRGRRHRYRASEV